MVNFTACVIKTNWLAIHEAKMKIRRRIVYT